MNRRSLIAAVLFPLAAIAGAVTWRVHERPSERFALPDTLELRPRAVVEIDGKAFALSVCRLEGPPLPIVDASERAAPWVAAAPDGGVYVLDAHRKLRHYTRTPSNTACELEHDRAFGMLDAGPDASSVAVSADGMIYVSSDHASWRVEGASLVPFADKPVRAWVSSRSIMIGLQLAAPGEEPRDVFASAIDSTGPSSARIHSVSALLDDTVLVHDVHVEGGVCMPEDLALEPSRGGRHVPLTGATYPGEAGRCTRDQSRPSTVLRGVDQAMRVGRSLWVYGFRHGVEVWRFDEREALQEKVALPLGRAQGPRNSSPARDGGLYLGVADDAAEPRGRFTGVILRLGEANVVRGRVRGQPFLAREIKIDRFDDGWKVSLWDGPTELDGDARITLSRWSVPETYTNKMIHGLADGTLTIDKPEEDTFVTGDFADAWVDNVPELRQRLSPHVL